MSDRESREHDKEFVVVSAETTPVKQLADAMNRQNVGSVVIVEGIKLRGIEGYHDPRDTDPVRVAGAEFEPVGIVTDRDIVLQVVHRDRDPKKVTAEEIMSQDLVVAERGEGLLEIVHRMDENECRRIPIVEDGELVDIVTMDDVLRILSEEIGSLAQLVRSESSYRKLETLL